MIAASLLAICRSGVASIGVVSVDVLLAGVGSAPFAPSSAIAVVLVKDVMLAGSGVTTITAKVALPPAPLPASAPMVRTQVVPAAEPSEQLQPAVLAPALKVVFAGTVSVIWTPVAFCAPALL